MLKKFIILSAPLALLISATLPAQTVYVYKDKNGNSVITNHRSNDRTLKLTRKYHPVSSIESLGSRHYRPSERRLETRSSAYDQTIFALADAYQQDRALIKAIVQIESSFDPKALSPKGAQGLMQLMPATASTYRVKNPFNAYQNLRGGIAYFSTLMKRYKNDVRMALAAYNAGESAVAKYQGIPPYPETQSYVKNVLKLHKHYQQRSDTYSS